MADASLKEAWLEEKKLEWERNQQQRSQRLALAKAPVARAAPVEPDDAALKRDWLRRKRREHEAMRAAAAQERQRAELAAPVEPDDAAVKKEWLRRQRLEHERANAERANLSSCGSLNALSAPEEPDDAALKREWLRRQREMHERALATRAAQPAEAERAPMVDTSLLSNTETPSERDVYLQQLHEERSFSQRERKQMEGLAQRRPSVPLALPAPEDAAAMELALANMDDEQYAYYFNYAECYEHEQEVLSTTSAAASSTTRSTTTAAERAETEGLDELEALEAMRAMELQASGKRQTRSERSASAGSSHSRGSSPGRSRPTSAHHRLGLSPGILPAPRRGSHSGEYYESLIPSPTLGPTLGHSTLGGGSYSERGRGGGSTPTDLHDVSGAQGRPHAMIVEESHAGQQQRLAGALPSGEGNNPALVALGDGDKGGSDGEREGSPLEFSLGFESPRGSSPGSSVHSPSMGALISPRGSAVLRLEDITVLKRR